MNRPLPTIGPMERALYLRSLPFFRELRSSDLAACAQLLYEVQVGRREVLFGTREGVPAIYLLVEGMVQTRWGERLVRVDQAPTIAGLTELMAARPAIPRAIAVTPLLALRLESAALLDLLEDHFTIYLELRRLLGAQLAELQLRTRDFHRVQRPKGWAAAPELGRALDSAERLLLLQRLPIFAGVGLGVLADLIRDRDESRVPAGEVLWQAGDEPSSLVVVVRGTLACRAGDDELRIEAGDIAGAEAVFGGRPHAYAAVADSDLTVLRIDAPVLVDLAEDNFDLAQGSLAHLSREVLRLQEAAATA